MEPESLAWESELLWMLSQWKVGFWKVSFKIQSGTFCFKQQESHSIGVHTKVLEDKSCHRWVVTLTCSRLYLGNTENWWNCWWWWCINILVYLCIITMSWMPADWSSIHQMFHHSRICIYVHMLYCYTCTHVHIHVCVYVSIMNKVFFLSAEKLSQGFATIPCYVPFGGDIVWCFWERDHVVPIAPKSRRAKTLNAGVQKRCWSILQYILVVLAVFKYI